MKLLQIEFIKITRRLAFWVTGGIFIAFCVLILLAILKSSGQTDGGISMNGQRLSALVLPDGWAASMANIFGAFSKTFFLPITVIILISSEFTFKTARQNVIDGLSKEQFFFSKALMVFCIALIYFLIFFILTFAFGYAGTNMAELKDPLIRLQDVYLFCGYVIVLFGYGCLAMFFAFITRSSGPGIGFFMLYTLIIENILSLLFGLKDSLKPIVKFLPTKVFDELLNPMRYDTAKLQKLKEQIDQAKAMGQQIPDQVTQLIPTTDNLVAYCIALGYIAVICGITYYIFKQRDL